MQLIPITAFPRELYPIVFLTNDVPNSTIQADQRFLYAAFIPDKHYPQSPTSSTKLPLLVVIHGTNRRNDRCLDAWRDFALNNRCAVVAPLFPCLVSGRQT